MVFDTLDNAMSTERFRAYYRAQEASNTATMADSDQFVGASHNGEEAPRQGGHECSRGPFGSPATPQKDPESSAGVLVVTASA